MIKRKAKGIAAERELLHLFWENGWACARIAGSGNTSFPSADLLAGNSQKIIAVECKTIKENKKYFTQEEIKEFAYFCQKMGVDAWIAIKFNRRPWYLLKVDDLSKTKTNWMVSQNLAIEKGLLLADFFQKHQKI